MLVNEIEWPATVAGHMSYGIMSTLIELAFREENATLSISTPRAEIRHEFPGPGAIANFLAFWH